MKTILVSVLSCALPALVCGAPPDADALESARRYSEAHGGQALVVMHAGKIIFEHYANGGAQDQRQMLASGSKSFVGVAAVAAVEDGLLTLDERVCETLTEWKDDTQKSAITYRQLLTLTSGLMAGEKGKAVNSPAWKEMLAKPMNGAPGERFEYGAYHLNVCAEALERKLEAAYNESFEDYLKRRVLDPLGIAVEWRLRCADGHPQVGGGAYTTARDWAVYGEFMRLEGQWQGKQIIAGEHLAECVKGTAQNPAYGLTWWLSEPVPEAIVRDVPILQRDMGDIVKSDWLPDDLYMAAGAGKQRLYVIPSRQLVIARQGDFRGGMSFHDADFLSHMLRGTAVNPETEGASSAAPNESPELKRLGVDREALIERFRKRRAGGDTPRPSAVPEDKPSTPAVQ